MVLYLLIEAIWFILPAYAANGMAPIFRGTHPMDGGRKFRGRSLFGPGKTWEGFFFGCIVAAFVGFIQMAAFQGMPFATSPVPILIVIMTPLLGLLLGFGAMFGDLVGSFIKRRTGIPRGRPVPLLDQIDFLLGAFLFGLILAPVRWQWILILLILTPVIHLIANSIGYVLKLSKTWY